MSRLFALLAPFLSAWTRVRQRFPWVDALWITLVLHTLLQGLAHWGLGVALSSFAWGLDLALHGLLAGLLWALTRKVGRFVWLVLPWMLLVHLGNAFKLSVLGAPITPSDFAALPALVRIAQGAWVILLFGLLFLLAFSLVFSVRLKDRYALASLGGLAVIFMAPVLWAEPLSRGLDARLGHSVWNQPGNYQARGPLLHFYQESARYHARSELPPSRFAVLQALEQHAMTHPPALRPVAHRLHPSDETQRAPRNVHMIVLESFWDPTLLGHIRFSEDPFGADFRFLWDNNGAARALSPVFGGYTANAEFEALCGFPVTRDEVIFESRLRNDVPCLPAVLREAGYYTLASHPNVPEFWNRTHTYRRIGFDRFLSQRDFIADDMNGDFLGDASLYRQVLERIDPFLESGQPVFNYVLTFFGHLDYPLNAQRPIQIGIEGSDSATLLRYTNTVFYKTRELMAFLEALRAKDPDSLILVFGDHLPFLGAHFAAYREGGLLADRREAFTDAMFETWVAAPLMLLDGLNGEGPALTDDVPLYQMPALTLERLGIPSDAHAIALTRTPPGLVIRPLPGLQVFRQEGEPVGTCRESPEDPPVCVMIREWLQTVELLGQDLFMGRQHLLEPTLRPKPDTGHEI